MDKTLKINIIVNMVKLKIKC